MSTAKRARARYPLLYRGNGLGVVAGMVEKPFQPWDDSGVDDKPALRKQRAKRTSLIQTVKMVTILICAAIAVISVLAWLILNFHT